MSFKTLFPDNADGITQLRVLNACVAAASAELTIWQGMAKIESVTDRRIKFSIDQVYALLSGLYISTILYTLQELEEDYGFITGASEGFEFLRLTPKLFKMSQPLPALDALAA
ncbi:hypothetical protein GCM10028803_00060 [Larkinella knui]|uniref:Uncharacterized protein n=1 Tax=Larkinella knui TaxID=2025310 RepID=A0A3P1CJG8_9BACT|nr:hypothetical protein [Larkinella knui]RRB13415.1 hypothetical protein EHT87_14155 [Larkinella knui]